jgi:hypothetical protein
LGAINDPRIEISNKPLSYGECTVPRTNTFNEQLSQKLQNPKYAREFILGLMEGPEGLSAEDALREAIKGMGVKEFSMLSKVPAPNIVAFVKGRRHPKIETFDQMLKVFKLRAKVVLEQVG